VGIRGGTSFEKETGYFRQVDAFAGINLPWRRNSYSGLYFKPRLEASAGWISGGGGDGFIGTLGPVIELHKGKFPVTLDFGASPTILSRYDFKQRDLGGWFQFSDHCRFGLAHYELFHRGLAVSAYVQCRNLRAEPGVESPDALGQLQFLIGTSNDS